MKRQYHVVEIRQPAILQRLRIKLDDTQHELEQLRVAYRRLESKYGFEIQLNSELIDLLNANDIPYREHLDFKLHPF